MGNVHDCCICIVEPAGTVGATTVCGTGADPEN